ncbi:nucleotidyltransferase family protein [Methylomonas rapida]|uniref:Nucleotidyltransferase family protein n=1 Tax=Methylomonas rapida TaxID=2963939 RepID=A0ABY7GGK9_9GAMM|nr:nucleotidyltransferase family protein [Methylomonas rapida]WAR44405.1 nucleotidyltransferase family protein [Methylomonas rapida]
MSLVVGILLAAGASTRFGADKLLQPLTEGEAVAVRACRNLLLGTDQVLAVVRSGSDVLAERLRDEGASVHVCDDAGLGMGASLAFAVQASADALGWVVALADMPWIEPSTIVRVTDALRAGATIAAPSWQGQRGHPVGFAGALRQPLQGLTGDVGAKSVIQAHGAQLRLLPCDDPGILLDIDQPNDLNKRNGKRFL